MERRCINLSIEVVRCGLDKEIGSNGVYDTYYPFEPMIERLQMTAYLDTISGLMSFTRNCLLTVPR